MSTSDVAKLLGVRRNDIQRWTAEYMEYLSNDARPGKGKARRFNANDLRALALIADQMEVESEPDEICIMLDRDDQHAEPWLQWSWLHSDVFQEPPDALDEDSYGALIGGMASRNAVDVAQSYFRATIALLEQAESKYEPHELDYPILSCSTLHRGVLEGTAEKSAGTS